METSEQDSETESQQQQQQPDADGRQDGVVESTTDERQSTTQNGISEDGALRRKCNVYADCCCCCPRRYIVFFLLFLGMCFVHAQRTNVGITVVSIVDDDVDETLSIDSQDNSSVIVAADSSVRLSIRLRL